MTLAARELLTHRRRASPGGLSDHFPNPRRPRLWQHASQPQTQPTTAPKIRSPLGTSEGFNFRTQSAIELLLTTDEAVHREHETTARPSSGPPETIPGSTSHDRASSHTPLEKATDYLPVLFQTPMADPTATLRSFEPQTKRRLFATRGRSSARGATLPPRQWLPASWLRGRRGCGVGPC